MNFNFKKVASVIASAVMLTSTVGFAAASTYPAPFTSGAAVVYGANAAPSDIAAAISISNNLNGKVTGTSATSVGAVGGDSIDQATSARKIYYGDALNAARTSISATEMSNVLKSGKIMDLRGTEYSYTQTIVPGTTASVFGTSGGDLKDPTLYLDVGTTATSPLYNYTLSFTGKVINVSDDTNVQGQKINILGVDYVIGASSTNSTLYLYGAGETVAMAGGESKTVTIGGTEHTVDFVGATSTTTAKIALDGISKTVTKGSSYSFTGDINVYVKDVTYQAYAGGVQSVELIIGANTLLLQSGSSVKVGADQNSIQGTLATIVAGGVGQISGFTVSVAAQKSQKDSLEVGQSFTDPVFGGLKLQFSDTVPALDSTSRAKIRVDTDNNQYAFVTFTGYNSGAKGEQRFTYAYDNLTAATTIQPLLAHQTLSSGKGRIHVLEGENALLNDWIVINQGDSGALVEITDIASGGTTTSPLCKVKIKDIISDVELTDYIELVNTTGGFSKTGVNIFGGNGYTIKSDGTCHNPTAATTVNITWSSAGTRTLFPRIKLKDGGWVALLESTTVSNQTSLIFPNGLTTLSTVGDLGRANATAVPDARTNLTYNGIVWGYIGSQNTNLTTIDTLSTGRGECTFNTTKGPAILYLEPKKWDDGSYGNIICTPMSTTGTLEIAIGDPVFNGTNSAFQTYSTDTYKKSAIDIYGTFVTKEDRTNENGVATISAPSSQMYLDVLFTSVGTTITPGTSGSSSGSAVSIITDTEVASYASSNLVVIGGSCVNAAAAKILGSTTPLCGADFTAATKVGAGQYIIKTVASPYADTGTGKVAMLVAGYEAAETTNAAKAVLAGADTTVDKETIEPTVTTTG